MNPNENNPISPAGAGGVASGATSYPGTAPVASDSGSVGAASATSSNVAAPVDFTSLGNNSGLSMSDSLASAQDNLTSAGQAANMSAAAPAIDQLGADKPAAEMDSPNQPLTPAAPLPGSIGSVSSGAPVVNTESTTATANPAMGGDTVVETVNAAPAAQPYYNPFASATAPTSATTKSVPPALQPQANSFKGMSGAAGKKSGVMSLLAWIIAVVLAGTTVLFAILWQMAENKPVKDNIVYVEKPVEEVGSISCVQNLGGGELEGSISMSRTMKANYKSGELDDISLMTGYDFVDADAAEATRGTFEEGSAYYVSIANGLAIQPITTDLQISGSRVDYTVSADAGQLMGDYLQVFGIPQSSDGTSETDITDLRQAYEGAGYVCAIAQ